MFSVVENLSCGANSIPRYFIKRKPMDVPHWHVLSSKMTSSVFQSTIGYTRRLFCITATRSLSLLRLLELVTSVALGYCFHLIFGWLAIPMAMFTIPSKDFLYSTTRGGLSSKANKCSKCYETLIVDSSSSRTVCRNSREDHTARLRCWSCPSKRTVRTCSVLQRWRHYLCISLPLRNDPLSIYNGGFNSAQCEKGRCKRSNTPLCLVPTGRLLFPCSRLLAVVVVFLSWSVTCMAAYVEDNGLDNYGEYSDFRYSSGNPAGDHLGEASEPPFGKRPGYVYSYNGKLPEKVMTEGIIICLLAVTAFISLVVWLAKTNFKESQQRRMRREASLRDKTLILQSEDDIV